MGTILDGIKQQKTKLILDGDEINLIPTLTINFTQNPDYQGRKTLPDNLKALFRTVAMMLPDYNLIAEIFLFSTGYFNATKLAKKIVAAYRLASEQVFDLFSSPLNTTTIGACDH